MNSYYDFCDKNGIEMLMSNIYSLLIKLSDLEKIVKANFIGVEPALLKSEENSEKEE
jgi:hypothetical protein